MPANIDELLAIERGFWNGGADYFEENTDLDCLVAFPRMAGVMNRADLADTARNPDRWKQLDIELKGVVEPSASVTVIAYEAKAVRADGEPYLALVSTGYVRRGDEWKMMFHSQTPLDPA